ncbi:MAG: TetR/AcrR family transcriptional regulator [Tropicimonas sp.]|uniref:TetR/AcrR family transcriptional regulator n=1 Tax=Tropicimonas sp. TaxID=2067044 RepID=UPI003A8C74B8
MAAIRTTPATSDAPSELATVRKSQARGRRSARKLLDTAAVLFLEKGVDATTVDDIVLQAGTAKGTFYHHYESKGALLDALREQMTDDFAKRIDAALEKCPPDDLPLVLDTWVEAAFEAYLGMDPLHEVVFGRISTRWSAGDEPFLQNLAALLAKGHARGIWHVENPHLTATFIFRGMLGAVDDLLLSGTPPATAFHGIADLARKAIARRP